MDTVVPQRLYGVIGWPLEQTLSPLLHNIGFRELGLPAVYMAWPLPPKDLKIFADAMRALKIAGCSVTIPHKVAILDCLDGVSEAASLAGAANTVYTRDDGFYGENTDVTGFLAPLAGVNLEKTDVLLLGAGGAARAVAAGLKLRGCVGARVASPSDKSQYPLAERFGFRAIKWAERYDKAASLVINATPLGMVGEGENLSAYDFAEAPKVADGAAYDLVYNPLRTRFILEAAKAGRKTITGLEMFWAQADAQFRLWTGERLPEAARKALLEKLGGDKA